MKLSINRGYKKCDVLSHKFMAVANCHLACGTSWPARSLHAKLAPVVLKIQNLPEADSRHIMTTLDALLRDAKARKAYA